MKMDYKNILIELSGKIATVTVNRPDKLNALNRETISELGIALKELEKESAVRVIILTGSGTKAFVAGADISEFSSFSVPQGKELSERGQKELFDVVENLSKPVIAAINGFALGGGLELAMAAHIRVASETAKMGLPEVSLGVIPGYGGTQRLPQLVGKGKAFEMIMTGDMITGAEAREWGLVNHVVKQEDLLNKAKEIAEKMITRSGTAIASAIRAVNAGFRDGVDGYESEIAEFGKCFGTAEFTEGTSAFVEKRKPQFN